MIILLLYLHWGSSRDLALNHKELPVLLVTVPEVSSGAEVKLKNIYKQESEEPVTIYNQYKVELQIKQSIYPLPFSL